MEARSKSFHGGVKGRRALHYGNSSLLKGKKIYLDLHGYKRAGFIESGLRERGAAIESFFTKDTRYLVTSRNLSEQEKYSSSPRTPSSNVLCSVNTNNRKGSSYPAQSPFSTNSPDTPKATPITVGRVSRDQHLAHHSRSRNIVAAAKMKSTGSMDVLQLAKNWNIRIIHVEDIGKYFSKHPVGAEVTPRSDHRKSSPGVRKLRAPFLKCEDMSRLYKPLICEVKKWPQLNLDCGPGACPFDTPQKQQRDSGGTKIKGEKSDKKQPGYCECCGVRFDDFTPHVKGDQHMAYANDPSNFSSLDAMYETYKIRTLEQFVAAHTERNMDCSTSPEIGSSPAKYSLLYRDDADEIATSIVDVETVTDPQVPQNSSLITDIVSKRQYSTDLVMLVKNSSPEPTAHIRTNAGDHTPTAKRYRRSQSNGSPSEDRPIQAECVTPSRPSPLKDFSIVLSDSLKSPMRSSTIISPNKAGESLSPKQCTVILHDVMRSPMSVVATSPETPANNRRIRSTSVSPKQTETCKDPLMESPVKEETNQSPFNIHTITADVSPKHLYRSQDILLMSSQPTPQKEPH